jgi:hypothetical protein
LNTWFSFLLLSRPSKLAVICLIVNQHSFSQHFHLSIRLPATSTTTLHQLVEAIQHEARSQPELDEVWQMVTAARSTFAVRTSQDHPPEGEKPQRGATRLIGPANSILRHNHGYNIYPASGRGAEQLMLELGLAFVFPIADETGSDVVEQILMDGDLFVVLLEDQEVEIISDEVCSAILAGAVSHIL